MKPRLRPSPALLLVLLVTLWTRAARALQIVLLDHARGGGGGVPSGPATAAPLAVDPRAPRWVSAVYADAETARRVSEPLLPRPQTTGDATAPPPSARHVVMTDSDGRRFNCTVPTGPVPLPTAEAAEKGPAAKGGGTPAAASKQQPPPLTPPSELLDALAGLCLYHQDAAGWTYEVCHRRQVRQFRGSGAAGGSEDFICGRYGGGAGAAGAANAWGGARGSAGGPAWPLPPNHPSRYLDEEQDHEYDDEAGEGERPKEGDRGAPSSSSRDRDEARVRVDRRGIGLAPGTPFLRHVYGSGASCALGNGQPRTAEVRYVCSDAVAGLAGGGGGGGGGGASWAGAQSGALVAVREFPSCHYVATVATPVLCVHPDFAARREDVRLVACAPLDDDEQEGRGGGGGASAVAATAVATAEDSGSSSTGAAQAEAAEAAEGLRIADKEAAAAADKTQKDEL